MTARTEPQPDLDEATRRVMRKYDFNAVVFINRPVSVRSVGSVEAWFRSVKDAKRFATTLNRLYGNDAYKGVSI